MSAETQKAPAARPRSRSRKILFTLIFLGIILLITGAIGELVLRWMLFGGSPKFAAMRNAGHYASERSPEYWSLVYYWDSVNRPPKHPHPLLGWRGPFNPKNYIHKDYAKSWGKRPVLLYGDSFSQCVDQVTCFQDFLNNDTAFSKNHYLLNYGTGGYGIDQIYLLMKETAPHYKNPFVVFGFLTKDLDRNILQFRTGQKPFFELAGDSLKLSGVPIAQNADSFFQAHPPGITSYIVRRFLHSKINFLPAFMNPKLRAEARYEKQIRELGEPLIKKAVADLNQLGVDYVILVFHTDDHFMRPEEEGDWRDTFLLRVLKESGAPFIWSKDIVKKNKEIPYAHDKYILPGDGHPTTYFNQLISREIAAKVLASTGHPERYTDTLDLHFFENQALKSMRDISSTPDWLENVKQQAESKNLPLRQMLWENAVYMMSEEK